MVSPNSVCICALRVCPNVMAYIWAGRCCRAACTRLHEGAEVAPEEELVIWVPARLLLCASKDADLAQHLTETLLRPGLLPAKVPLATAARQWAAIYMSSTAQVWHPGVASFHILAISFASVTPASEQVLKFAHC